MNIIFSNLVIKNSYISTNYAILSAHVFALIQSNIQVVNSVFDNSLNNLNVPYAIINS